MGLVKRKPADSAAAAPAPRTREQLVASLHDEERAVRLAAARDLAAYPDAATELITRFAKESDRGVRDAIGTALVSCGSSEAGALLAPHLAAGDASLRNAARELLSLVEGADEIARVLLDDADPDVRMFAIEILFARLASGASAPVIRRLEHEEDQNVCAFAAELLGEHGGLEHVPCLDALAERFASEEFVAFAIVSARKRILSRTCDIPDVN